MTRSVTNKALIRGLAGMIDAEVSAIRLALIAENETKLQIALATLAQLATCMDEAIVEGVA